MNTHKFDLGHDDYENIVGMRQDGDGHTGGRDPSKAGLFDFDYDKGDLVLWPTTSGIATSGTVAQIDEAHFDAVRSRLAAATQLADF